ncbi:MAG: single-stranded DNA-binding protein [Deltaproteobacteria bacterium]|nr:single-stranded DNA-binding protein [Deltaproteobacteria bacterium]
MSLATIARELCAEVERLHFGPPVAYVYNPLRYARAAHESYLRRYGAGEKEVVLLGMNPGPFGMAQTGVPFGDVATVRDWLRIDRPVGAPERQHPKRPVLGLGCPRVEVSGARLWGWARARFGTPERFFARFFVANYCPLCFMHRSGANLTPDKLPAKEREPLLGACDRALRRTVALLRPQYVVGVGAFAAGRAAACLAGLDVRVSTVLHPSPASPRANRGWQEAAEAELRAAGIDL